MNSSLKKENDADKIIDSALHHTLSVYVNNKPGVLMRICQVFSRRGYNIESLVVSHGRHNSLSRMTISVDGEPEKLEQIISQMNKIIDVVHCVKHDEQSLLSKELALIKIKITNEIFFEVSNAIQHVDGQVIDKADDYVIASIVSNSQTIDWVLRVLGQFEITEIMRTGQIVMVRDNSNT